MAVQERTEGAQIVRAQSLGTVGIAPQPLAKPALECFGLFLRGQSLLLVDHTAAGVELVDNLRQPTVQKVMDDAQC